MKMKALLDQIDQADAEELGDILDAAIARYQMLYPEWEINFYALPRWDEKQRKESYKKILTLAKKYGRI